VLSELLLMALNMYCLAMRVGVLHSVGVRVGQGAPVNASQHHSQQPVSIKVSRLHGLCDMQAAKAWLTVLAVKARTLHSQQNTPMLDAALSMHTLSTPSDPLAASDRLATRCC
jgi:hypothetical protein